MTLIRGKLSPHSPPLPFSQCVMCAWLLHYLSRCIHRKWPYTSVNMSSHWWWHPKSWPPSPPLAPSLMVRHHCTGFCGDYPLSLTMSANDRAGAILKWFLPSQSATYVGEGGQNDVYVRGVSLGLSVCCSLCFAPLLLNRHRELERSVHSRAT